MADPRSASMEKRNNPKSKFNVASFASVHTNPLLPKSHLLDKGGLNRGRGEGKGISVTINPECATLNFIPTNERENLSKTDHLRPTVSQEKPAKLSAEAVGLFLTPVVRFVHTCAFWCQTKVFAATSETTRLRCCHRTIVGAFISDADAAHRPRIFSLVRKQKASLEENLRALLRLTSPHFMHNGDKHISMLYP